MVLAFDFIKRVAKCSEEIFIGCNNASIEIKLNNRLGFANRIQFAIQLGFRICDVYADKNKIRVLERIHFATDREEILPESASLLEEIAEYIKAHPEWLEILIEGHADVRADDAYNLALSQRRANSVLNRLLLRGVEPGRLRAQGFGKSRPIADNSTEDGMALNRRVEFTILKVAPGHQLPSVAGPEQLKVEPVIIRSQN